ncbi:MFS transporter [Salidesulfovibrio brasiliensis]|uniref:MFS transporter n=1 Tax=Salidesulfovibrio brasiliensis TaxID=221711 RepID=UPI0006CFECDC|nr:MFS transporter [Salidesulfovibrio brasiliensis]
MRKLYLDRNLQYVFCVTLMAILGVSSIIPALPDIMHGLDIGPAAIGALISIFTLPGVLFSPLVGVLADRMGRKRILVPALFLFGIAGTACFFAPNLHSLLILRFLQGVGAAPLGVLYGTIIGDLYQGRERAAAMGYNAAVLSVGTAAFPAVGGLLATIGWQWPFLLPLLAIPVGLIIAAGLDAPEPESNQNLGNYLRDAFAQMRKPEVLALFGTTLLTFTVLYGPIVTYLPILLAKKYDASPASIGMIFFASSMITAVASFQLGKLASLFGQRTLIIAAGLCYALSMLGLPHMPDFWHTVLPVTFFGLAQGLSIPTVMTMLSSMAGIEQRGAFMAANGMILRTSQTAAPMIMGGIYAALGMHAVFYAGLACAVGIIILAALCMKS